MQKLVEVTRSGFIESVHYGCGAIVDSSGKILKEWGDSSELIYPRSALKPIQALNLYKDGYIEKANLSENQIALSTSSHFAEEIHKEIIEKWLTALNIDESKLACGEDWPWQLKDKFKAYDKFKKKRKIFHNCSGKHCAHLALCKDRDLPIENYNSKDHKIQIQLFELIEDIIKFKLKNIGVDGCTLPNPLLPLNKFAYLLASFSDFEKLGELGIVSKKIFNSCVNKPEYTGGKESDNSILTKILEKKVFFKNGAEGIFAALVPEKKCAIVVKISDGNSRASSTAIAGMVSELNIIHKDKLENLLNKPVHNSIDNIVGNICWVG